MSERDNKQICNTSQLSSFGFSALARRQMNANKKAQTVGSPTASYSPGMSKPKLIKTVQKADNFDQKFSATSPQSREQKLFVESRKAALAANSPGKRTISTLSAIMNREGNRRIQLSSAQSTVRAPSNLRITEQPLANDHSLDEIESNEADQFPTITGTNSRLSAALPVASLESQHHTQMKILNTNEETILQDWKNSDEELTPEAEKLSSESKQSQLNAVAAIQQSKKNQRITARCKLEQAIKEEPMSVHLSVIAGNYDSDNDMGAENCPSPTPRNFNDANPVYTSLNLNSLQKFNNSDYRPKCNEKAFGSFIGQGKKKKTFVSDKSSRLKRSTTSQALSTVKPNKGSSYQMTRCLETFSSKTSSCEQIDCRILTKKTSFVQKKALIDNKGVKIDTFLFKPQNRQADAQISPERDVASKNMSHLVLDQQLAYGNQKNQQTPQDVKLQKPKNTPGRMSLMPPQKIREAVKQLQASESGHIPQTHSKLFPKKTPSLVKYNSNIQSKLKDPPFRKTQPQNKNETSRNFLRQSSADGVKSQFARLLQPLVSRSPPRDRIQQQFPNKHQLQKTIPNFRNNIPRQVVINDARQKLSSRTSEKTGRVSNTESCAEQQRHSIQPEIQQRQWLYDDDINSQQGSEDARIAIARRKEPPVRNTQSPEILTQPAKQLFQPKLSPKSHQRQKANRVNFSPVQADKNRKTLVMTKGAVGDSQKLTKIFDDTEENFGSIKKINQGKTSQQKLEVSYAGLKVRKSCPVKEKEKLENSPRCIFRESDQENESYKHFTNEATLNPFTPCNDMGDTQRLVIEEETNQIPVEYTRRQTFARVPWTQIKQQPSITFSQGKETERDVLRESKSLEGIRGRRPQVPPDDDLVCGSFLIISPQSSENQNYNNQNKINFEGGKMERRKVIQNNPQRSMDPLDKVWAEFSNKSDKQNERKEVPKYHIQKPQPRRGKPNPFADPQDANQAQKIFSPLINDKQAGKEPISPLTPNQPLNLAQANNEMMSSTIHVEGQVLGVTQTDTPAEKAKRRVSMADRMTESQSKQIMQQLMHPKKSEQLNRLENDVLNLNQNPAEQPRRMTMPQVLQRENFTNRLTVVAGQRQQNGVSAQRGTHLEHPPQKQAVDRDDVSPRLHQDETINNPESKEMNSSEPKSGIVDMFNKALGNFFGRQSELNRAGSINEYTENVQNDWPPKPERTPVKENNFILQAAQMSSEELIIECEKCGAKVPQSKIDIHEQGCIVFECQYCKKMISSTIIDEHEKQCSDELSMSAKKRMMGMLETKVTSERNAVISKVEETSEDIGDVGSSNEQTPERNIIVHEQQINDRRSDKESKSPLLIKNETKIRMIAAGKPPTMQNKEENALNTMTSETLQREKKLQDARRNRINLDKSARKNRSVRPRLLNATTESSLHLSRRNTQMIKIPSGINRKQSNVLVSPQDVRKTSSVNKKEDIPQVSARQERQGSFLGGILDVVTGRKMPSAEEIQEKPAPQSSRDDNNKSNTKNQLTLNTLTSSTSKKESPAAVKTQSGILSSLTAQKDPQASQPEKVPLHMLKGQSHKLDSDRIHSPLKKSPIEAMEIKHKSPPMYDKSKMGTLVSGRRATLNYGLLQRKEMVMPKSGGSMSTNDQSNPSPNMGMGSNQQMQNRTQILKGLLPNEAMEKYEDELTPFEKSELSTYEQIYTIGSFRVNGLKSIADREGFYKAKIGEQIGYRYIVDQNIDAGAFGQVMKAIDMKEGGREVALKLSKNKKSETDNAQVEAKLLKKILGKDPDKYCIVKMLDAFYFRKHYVIVFELLESNLYKYIKEPSFTGMKKDHLREIATQMLYGLAHLSKIKIIHCDLKPENVVFTDQTRQAVKIIDFGSACTEFKQGFVYVQSRFYRSPEVVLGLPYDQAVDMWSFGCILAELVTGRPLFPAIDEKELLEWILIRIGHMPEHMIKNCTKRRQFYDANMTLIRSARSRIPRGSQPVCDSVRNALYSEDDDEFIDFIEKCLILDPTKRLTPEKGLKHNWIKRSKVQSMFKENALVSNHLLQDLEDVMKPLPNNRRERYHHNNKLQLLRQESGRVSGPGNRFQANSLQKEDTIQEKTSAGQGQTNVAPKTQEASDIHNNKS